MQLDIVIGRILKRKNLISMEIDDMDDYWDVSKFENIFLN